MWFPPGRGWILIPPPIGRCLIPHAFPLPFVPISVIPRVPRGIYLWGGVIPPIIRCVLEFRRIVAPLPARQWLLIVIVGGGGVISSAPVRCRLGGIGG